jgi:hypothetical protein
MLWSFVRKSIVAGAMVVVASLAAPLNSAAVAPGGATGALQGTVTYSPGLGVSAGGSQSFTMSGTLTGVTAGDGASVGNSTFTGSGTESGAGLAEGVGTLSMTFTGAVSGTATGTLARTGPVPIIVLHGFICVLAVCECYNIGIAGWYSITGPPPAIVIILVGWWGIAPGTTC